jgi:hypothetical protein
MVEVLGVAAYCRGNLEVGEFVRTISQVRITSFVDYVVLY